MADEKTKENNGAPENEKKEDKKDKENKEVNEAEAKEGEEVKSEKKEKEEPKKSDDKTDGEAKEENEDEDDEKKDEELLLDEYRESIPLTPENASFYRSKGNLISLDLINAKGEKENFERVVILRAFPITNPNEFLSVREPDSKKMGRGKEIGMIRYMKDFDETSQKLFLEELDRRYFTPQLTKILAVKEKFGYLYWDAETSAGHVTFVLSNPFYNIRVLEDGRIIINDIDGNVFEITEPRKLDPASFKKVEVYL